MLTSIPTEDHLARLYFELSEIGAACVGDEKPWPYHPRNSEELLCLAADMSRYDPRLMTILVRFLNDNWDTLNPQTMRSHYNGMKTSQTIAVLAEFVLGACGGDDEKRYFFGYLQRGLAPVATQFYFHHLYSPGGTLAKRATLKSLAEYKRWGFLATEAPVIDEARRQTLGTLDAATRKNILYDLMKERKRITISDYLDALDNKISRQQALLDLKSAKWARRSGRGRGAYWRFAA
jgi:hypothetical protein